MMTNDDSKQTVKVISISLSLSLIPLVQFMYHVFGGNGLEELIPLQAYSWFEISFPSRLVVILRLKNLLFTHN